MGPRAELARRIDGVVGVMEHGLFIGMASEAIIGSETGTRVDAEDAMKAAVLSHGALRVMDVPRPEPGPGQVLLKVRACGVCRTDLHILDGELPPLRDAVIPGHQIVGDMSETGARVGVSWIGGTDGVCPYCRRGEENLCDAPTFTGYTVDGGYAEYAVARADFVFPLPAALDDLHAAPLLCAGIIGFRSLRVAGVQRGERVGLFGFGASAHLAIAVLQSWGCEVYVATRGAAHRQAGGIAGRGVGRDARRSARRWRSIARSRSRRAAT